jgi:hypothetical protein
MDKLIPNLAGFSHRHLIYLSFSLHFVWRPRKLFPLHGYWVPTMNEVTRVSAIEAGDPHAAEQLLPLVSPPQLPTAVGGTLAPGWPAGCARAAIHCKHDLRPIGFRKNLDVFWLPAMQPPGLAMRRRRR